MDNNEEKKGAESETGTVSDMALKDGTALFLKQSVEEPPRILVVDDDGDILEILSHLLEIKGWECRTCQSSFEAAQIIDREMFDLMIFDINMPGMNGLELARLLQRNPDYASVPVIFLTGNNSVEDILKGFQAGGTDYILKPFVKDELLARCDVHIQLHRELRKTERMRKELEYKLEDSRKEVRRLQTVLTDEDVSVSERNRSLSRIREGLTRLLTDDLKILSDKLNRYREELEGKQFAGDRFSDSDLHLVTYSDLTRQLKALTPDLVTSELKICIMILDGMQSKGIAHSLGLSVGTVEQARYRIRKKMNIPQGLSLSHYLFRTIKT